MYRSWTGYIFLNSSYTHKKPFIIYIHEYLTTGYWIYTLILEYLIYTWILEYWQLDINLDTWIIDNGYIPGYLNTGYMPEYLSTGYRISTWLLEYWILDIYPDTWIFEYWVLKYLILHIYPTLHLNRLARRWILFWGIPTHTGWKREWQDEHSNSGIPVTPGQNGEQGLKFETEGPLKISKIKFLWHWKTILLC